MLFYLEVVTGNAVGGIDTAGEAFATEKRAPNHKKVGSGRRARSQLWRGQGGRG